MHEHTTNNVYHATFKVTTQLTASNAHFHSVL